MLGWTHTLLALASGSRRAFKQGLVEGVAMVPNRLSARGTKGVRPGIAQEPRGGKGKEVCGSLEGWHLGGKDG